MRSFLAGAMLLAATASQAGAQITFSSAPGAPDPGVLPPGQVIVDFNGGPYTGVSFSGSYSIVTGSIGGQAAPPAGVRNGYFVVPQTGPNTPSRGTAILDFSGFLATNTITSLSFYWGSIDQFNLLRFLDASGNPIGISIGSAELTQISGTNVVAPANGNQTAANTNRRVTFNLEGARDFRALELTSNGRAFEIDDIAVVAQGTQPGIVVPEPATFALLGAGLVGLAGVARRRRVS